MSSQRTNALSSPQQAPHQAPRRVVGSHQQQTWRPITRSGQYLHQNLAAGGVHECEAQCHYCQGPETD